MKDNMDRDIPYVSKELCEYLREHFSLPQCIAQEMKRDEMKGVNDIIEYLESIQRMQEENDGLRG